MECIICYNNIYYGIKHHTCHIKHLICHTCYLYMINSECSLCRNDEQIYNIYKVDLDNNCNLVSILNYLPFNYLVSCSLVQGYSVSKYKSLELLNDLVGIIEYYDYQYIINKSRLNYINMIYFGNNLTFLLLSTALYLLMEDLSTNVIYCYNHNKAIYCYPSNYYYLNFISRSVILLLLLMTIIGSIYYFYKSFNKNNINIFQYTWMNKIIEKK